MVHLPNEIMKHIYEFDSTYHIEYKKVLLELKQNNINSNKNDEYLQFFLVIFYYIIFYNILHMF
jgi:hypothetical protein